MKAKSELNRHLAPTVNLCPVYAIFFVFRVHSTRPVSKWANFMQFRFPLNVISISKLLRCVAEYINLKIVTPICKFWKWKVIVVILKFALRIVRIKSLVNTCFYPDVRWVEWHHDIAFSRDFLTITDRILLQSFIG